jgi:hypothetical protein
VAGIEINTRLSARSAQPRSVGDVPQDRIQADGSIITRNTERKDNEFFTLDLRVTRRLRLARDTALEPIFEVFNLTNSRNIKRPEVTNLVFNFDGTVQSGFGGSPATPARPSAHLLRFEVRGQRFKGAERARRLWLRDSARKPPRRSTCPLRSSSVALQTLNVEP